MYIKIFFNEGQYITIKLLEKSAIRRWFKNFKVVEESYTCSYQPEYNYNNSFQSIRNRKNIILAFDRLNQLGYACPFTLSIESEFDQPLLNDLHRFFTYNATWGKEVILKKQSIINDYDPSFKISKRMSYSTWHSIIDIINLNVHVLEKTIPLSKKIDFCSNIFLLQPSPHNSWFSFLNDEIQEINISHLDYKIGPPVVLNNSILGKCYLQSYLEDDDPTADDCTGRLGSFGGFNVLFTEDRLKVYETSDFIDWTKRHNLDVNKLHLEAQIGNIIDTSFSDFLKFRYISKFKMERLEFIDES